MKRGERWLLPDGVDEVLPPDAEPLERLRRDMRRFGVLHKWHDPPERIDNDFYFVLGRVDPSLAPPPALEEARAALARLS